MIKAATHASSGVTRGLSQGAKLSWRGPTGNRRGAH